jgi:hypothetical protein
MLFWFLYTTLEIIVLFRIVFFPQRSLSLNGILIPSALMILRHSDRQSFLYFVCFFPKFSLISSLLASSIEKDKTQDHCTVKAA